MKPRYALLCFFLVLLLPLSLEGVEVPELGSLDFPNSGAEEAQLPFARGVLLLHSFEYVDAREAFQEARELDPDFALAFWGEAMTHNHPLWRQVDVEAARRVLKELGETADQRLAGAPTERERGYLRALEALYFGPGDKVDRDRAYEEAMRSLSEAHPEDLEAKAFYALSILGSAQGVRDFRVYMRAGAVAEEVFAANERHPGAAHYLIHSYDDPIHAPLGLRAARVYNEIAPAASHAQHMISHIFVGLGRWEETAEANVRAWDVSVERAERKELGVDARNFHALHWLQYAHLQQGRHEEAAGELRRMREMAEESRTPRALWYHSAMRAAQIVEAGTPAPPPIQPEGEAGSRPWVGVFDQFAAGWVAAAAGEGERVREAVREIRSVIASSREETTDPADVYAGFNDEDRKAAEVLALELEALAQKLSGDSEAALASLDRATELEASRALEFGPPVIVKPSFELRGELLLELGRPEAALESFRQALDLAPRRTLSLIGQARAAGALDRRELVDRVCNELAEIRRGADDGAVEAACEGAGREVAGIGR